MKARAAQRECADTVILCMAYMALASSLTDSACGNRPLAPPYNTGTPAFNLSPTSLTPGNQPIGTPSRAQACY